LQKLFETEKSKLPDKGKVGFISANY